MSFLEQLLYEIMFVNFSSVSNITKNIFLSYYLLMLILSKKKLHKLFFFSIASLLRENGNILTW